MEGVGLCPPSPTHILALLSQKENKGRLPASGKDATHPESHMDADSVRSVSTLSLGENISTHSHASTMDIGFSCLYAFALRISF
jgi:hypothetical protein